jgi:hypothetical protein
MESFNACIFNLLTKKMKLYPIETGNFKLDGGAMFGVVPKTIWVELILPMLLISSIRKPLL